MYFENCSLDELLFDVEMVDTEEITGIKANSEYEKTIIGNFPDGKVILNTCSDRYKLIPNSTIFPQLKNVLLSLNIDFEETYRMSEDRSMFYVEYVIKDDRFSIDMGDGDKIYLRIAVTHSYNGLLKYQILFGFWRMICTNGLVVPVEKMKDYNLMIVGKHTEKINVSLNMFKDRLVALLANPENITEIANIYNILRDKKVIAPNVNKTIEKIAEKVKIPLIKVGKSGGTINYLRSIIDTEKTHYGNNVNLWLIYNAFNRFVYDDNLNKANPDKRIAKDEKLLKTVLELAK